MIFEYGTSLAKFQDSLIDKVKNSKEITEEELKRLTKNVWVKLAKKLAPCNLVIRQFCLIDIAINHYSNIPNLIETLPHLVFQSQNSSIKLWVEGYSYWLYTRSVLELYLDTVRMPKKTAFKLVKFIADIDKGFSVSAYVRDNTLYPAPFGDLRNVPLECQENMINENIEIGPIKKSKNLYYVTKSPLGFNLHVSNKNDAIEIVDGLPIIVTEKENKPFKWYEGYDKKYPTQFDELEDGLDFGRFRSAYKLLFEKHNHNMVFDDYQTNTIFTNDLEDYPQILVKRKPTDIGF